MRFFKDLGIMFIVEVKRYYRWKERIVWDVLGSLIMFFGFIIVWRAIIMGGFQGIGGLTAENYITFILSGTILWQVITQSLGWQMARAFVREKHRRILPYVMASPLNKISYLYAKVGVSFVRFVINNTILITIAFLFFDFSFKGSILLTIGFFILTFISFSGIGVSVASLAAWREGIGDVGMIIIDILYLFSGVHYPIEVFPESIRRIANLLPTTQAIHAVRKIGLYGAGLTEITPQIIYIGSLAIVTTILGYITFNKMKDKAMIIGI